MPGNGRRQTSSPTSPRTERPSASTTSIAIPSAGPPSESSLIGIAGVGERKQAPTSVPPEQLMIGQRPPPTLSKSQRYGPGFQGSPVVTIMRSEPRFACGSPSGMSARMSVGEQPRIVTRSCSIRRQRRSGGVSGAPSMKTSAHPIAPPPTTVQGPMIQPMSVANRITSPGCPSAWYAASRAIETRKPPWTWSAPFGLPVVPDVYASRYGCSESTWLGVRPLALSETSSSHHRSRPSVIGTSSRAPRRQTTVWVTLGALSRASSAISFIGTICPRRSEPSAVISAFALASASRAAIAGAANPEKIGTCTAPRCAQAWDAIATCGDMGRKIPTASPAPIPSEASPSARRNTSSDSSCQVIEVRPPSSLSHTAASSPPSSEAAQRWTQFQARFSFPPTNHVAHSIPRVVSITCSHGSENSRPRSSTTAGQNRSGSSTDMPWSASYPSTPSRRARRVRFAVSIRSASGRQTKSVTSGRLRPTSNVNAVRARLFAQENRKWWTLAAVTFGLFMIMLDNTVVNVALPAMQDDLQISQSGLEWVVNAYALTFGVLLLSGGKLADLLGRRRIFIVGLVIFTASSLWCGLAGSPASLIAARTVQGVGAALMNPATLSIIMATFPARQRGTAIGIWAGVSALALAIGPLVGGVLTERISWSWIFFVNVPVGVVAVLAARAFIDETKDTSREQRLDLPGLVSSAVGLFALTYGLIETNTHAWGSTRVLSLLALAALALTVFVLLELRQRVPMLDLSLFRNPTFVGANTAMALVGLAMFGIFFYNSLFLQNVLGYSATQT